jgi:hypothetical protein
VGRAGTDLSRDDGLTSLTALNNSADGLGDADLSHGAISDRTSPDHVPPNNDETVSRDLPPSVYSPPPELRADISRRKRAFRRVYAKREVPSWVTKNFLGHLPGLWADAVARPRLRKALPAVGRSGP